MLLWIWNRQFCKKRKNWAENGEKGVKNMHFRAFLDNQTLDLSVFWYETSLIYFFRFDTGSDASKNICGPKKPKTPYKLAGIYILEITN